MDARDLDMLGKRMPTEDTISRQAAIDAIERNAYRHTYIEQIVGIINALPSAQPDLSEEDRQLIKKLRSYHNGSYAAVLDKLIAPRVADAVMRGEEDDR